MSTARLPGRPHGPRQQHQSRVGMHRACCSHVVFTAQQLVIDAPLARINSYLLVLLTCSLPARGLSVSRWGDFSRGGAGRGGAGRDGAKTGGQVSRSHTAKVSLTVLSPVNDGVYVKFILKEHATIVLKMR